MVMNEKEARRIDRISRLNPTEEEIPLMIFNQALGYLEAIEKVKGLEKTLGVISREVNKPMCGERVWTTANYDTKTHSALIAKQALTKWEKEK